jgi:pilus assembly protein Flp/PilA
MATQKLNSVVDFWDKTIDEGLWDVVLLVPDFYLKNDPVFLYFNVTLHHIQRDIQAALASPSALTKPTWSQASVTTGFKTRPAAVQSPLDTSNGARQSHNGVGAHPRKIDRMVHEPDAEEIVLYSGSSQMGGSRSRRFLVTKSEKDMSKFLEISKRFMRDESGVTAIEYGLIASIIAVGLATALPAVATAISTAFSTIVDAM